MHIPIHWADKIAEELIATGAQIHVIATGITPSGPVHIGNMREVLTADAILRALKDKRAHAKLLYIADDYDPLRRKYPFLPEKFSQYIGKPLVEIPCPENCCQNYAQHFLKPFFESLDRLGIHPEIHLSSEAYRSGKYTKLIKLALTHKDEIKKILEEKTGRKMPEDWAPFNVRCEKCGRLNTTFVKKLENNKVHYFCKACNIEGKVDITKGNGKLPWRIDWPARWVIFGVTCEPMGKDHAVAGGSYDTGKEIVKLFGGQAPYPVPYEWIYFKGKGAMKSSKGIAFTGAQWLQVAPPETLRYLVIRTKPLKHIEFDPQFGLIDIIDQYDRTERIYFGKEISEIREEAEEMKRSYELSQIKEIPRQLILALPYKFASILVQVLLDKQTQLQKTVEILRRTGHLTESPTDVELKKTKERLELAEKWINWYAPEGMKFKLLETLPENIISQLTAEQKQSLKELKQSLQAKDWTPVDLHNEFYRIATEAKIKPQQLFEAAYQVLTGKKFGPRLGWFLLSLDKPWILKRLEEAAS
ncbi:MAG: lysine--tRNA ligase [Euryarchaeota archaeon]|nr:lysine--tRNA ligase [Euryarchaeota archaeon]